MSGHSQARQSYLTKSLRRPRPAQLQSQVTVAVGKRSAQSSLLGAPRAPLVGGVISISLVESPASEKEESQDLLREITSSGFVASERVIKMEKGVRWEVGEAGVGDGSKPGDAMDSPQLILVGFMEESCLVSDLGIGSQCVEPRGYARYSHAESRRVPDPDSNRTPQRPSSTSTHPHSSRRIYRPDLSACEYPCHLTDSLSLYRLLRDSSRSRMMGRASEPSEQDSPQPLSMSRRRAWSMRSVGL